MMALNGLICVRNQAIHESKTLVTFSILIFTPMHSKLVQGFFLYEIENLTACYQC